MFGASLRLFFYMIHASVHYSYVLNLVTIVFYLMEFSLILKKFNLIFFFFLIYKIVNSIHEKCEGGSGKKQESRGKGFLFISLFFIFIFFLSFILFSINLIHLFLSRSKML